MQFVSVFDFESNPQRIFAVHELACMVDGSFATKVTVNFNLSGGTILKLSARPEHRALLKDFDSVEAVGCFCLTELGWGNNAVKLETTAVYDASSKTWDIHTPNTLASKYWISNGYRDAQWAVVFAQAYVGGQHEGVQGFLVRVRDAALRVAPGVSIQDHGDKFGQSGVDNALIRFDHVKAPLSALLNRYADVDAATGVFSSAIKSPRGRFLVALNQLYSGRLCLASKAVGRTKQALAIALRYSASRLSVGPGGDSDTPILEYALQRRALLPLVARCVVVSGSGMNEVKRRYSRESTAGGQGLGQLADETMVLCSGLKAVVTWNCERTASVCRERMGGAGFLGANMFKEILGDAHAICTAEGDNAVLMQKVAKEVLAFYRKGKLEPVSDFADRWELRSLRFLAFLLRKREALAVAELQAKMDAAKARGESVYQVWMLRESQLVQGLAMAYVERFCFDAMLQSLPTAAPGARPVLEDLARLFALDVVAKDPSFLTADVLPVKLFKEAVDEVGALSGELAEQALQLVDAFGIPEGLLPPAARDWVKFNEQENNGQVLHMDF